MLLHSLALWGYGFELVDCHAGLNLCHVMEEAVISIGHEKPLTAITWAVILSRLRYGSNETTRATGNIGSHSPVPPHSLAPGSTALNLGLHFKISF